MELESNESTQDGGLPSFIESSPIGKDLLEGQAQELIAKSIANLIVSNGTENKLLGLDGAWGSGKSNLVKILKSKLEESHHFFVYDAWGHQEDLQRRSFLEELTADLCKYEVVDSSIWEDKLKNLLSRKRETLTKTIPRLSYGVIATILVAVFTPIFQTIAEVARSPVPKTLITSIPLLIGVVAYIVASVRARRLLCIQDIYALYKDKELSNETHVTIFEKEPSVKKFQKWMGQLSSALTTKKLVVVFDNMDRLPPDKVRELWSSIHTFFAEDSFEGIWIIVPFDRKHISAAFKEKSGTSEEVSEKMSEEFLRKSFSVIYRVAPPVLTDWQKFFDKKFKEAFKGGEEDELQYVRRIFDRLQKEITPRSIISCINEMVSLRRIVEKEILLRYIAVFVLAKKDILTAPVDQILNRQYLKGAAPVFAGDENLPDNIAALVYHVPLASASQVALTREIQNSLNNEDGLRLCELASYPHFLDILEQAVAGDDLDVGSAAATIAVLEMPEDQDPSVILPDRMINIWDDLCAKETENPLSEQSFTNTHKLLLERCSNPRRTGLVRHLVKEIRDADDFNGAKYYQALSGLHKCIQENNLGIDTLPMLTDIKKPPEIFKDYVGAAQSDYKKFKLKCEESGLHTYIINRIPDGLDGLSVLSIVAGDYDFAPVVQRLKKEVTSGSLTAQNVGPFYKIYRALSKEKPIKALKPDWLENLLSQVEDDSDAQFDLLAMRLAAGSEFPNIGGISESILDDTGEDTVTRIAERIEYYGDYDDLLSSYLSWQQPILKAVLTNIMLDRDADSKLIITKVLQDYSALKSALDFAPEDFMKKLDGWSENAEESITVENISDHVTDYLVFEDAVEVDCDLTRHLIETARKWLVSLGVDEWRNALRDVESYIFNVTYHLLAAGKLKRVPDNAVTVYRDLLIEVAKGEFQMDEDNGWGVFYTNTHKGKLKATAKNIRDLFISKVSITPDQFMFFSDLLLNHGALGQERADVARKILTPVGDDDECLKFIVNNDQQFIPILNDAGDDAADFKDIVRQKLAALQADEELIRFAKAIGVDADDSGTGETDQDK